MKKYFKKLFVFIILVIISLSAIFYVKADSGWDSDYGGGSDWSSSFDWGDYSDSGGIGGEFTGSVGDILFLVFIVSLITGLIIFGYKYTGKINKKYLMENEVSDDIYNKYLNIPRKQLRKILYNIYFEVEKSKLFLTYDYLKKFTTEKMYDNIVEEIKKLEEDNLFRVRKKIRKNKILIKNVESINNDIIISLDLNVYLVDYFIDKTTNKIVKGNLNNVKNESHSLKFVMNNGSFYLDEDNNNYNYNKEFNNDNNTDNTSYQEIEDDNYHNYFKISKDELKNKISKQFIDIQESWMNFDYENLRKLCTDELYNQYKTLLETSKLKNEQNIMSDFLVKEISIYDVKQINDIIKINVYLDIKFKDYVISTKNNKVVRGSKNIFFNNSYELEFVKSINNKITKCPSCGAKVNVKSSEVCEYCHNTIVQISDELVLSKKKIVSSRKTER